MQLSPEAMNPQRFLDPVPAVEHSTEEGFVYGQAPQAPTVVPDVDAMLQAAEIPASDGLPFSAEWYRGAKDRQIARDAQKKEFEIRKDQLRAQWANMVATELGTWRGKVDAVSQEPQVIGGLGELLARCAHERPSDQDRRDNLQQHLAKARDDQRLLEERLGAAHEALQTCEDSVKTREVADAAAEAERVRLVKEQEAKKRRGQRLLQRNAALLRGEASPLEDDEDEDEEKSGEPLQAQGGAEQPASNIESFATAPPMPPVPPGGQRGGLYGELPPLEKRPQPPVL